MYPGGPPCGHLLVLLHYFPMVVLHVPSSPPWGHLVLLSHFPMGDLHVPKLLAIPPQTFRKRRLQGTGSGLLPLYSGPRARLLAMHPTLEQLGPWPPSLGHPLMPDTSHTHRNLKAVTLSAGLHSCPLPPLCPSVCLDSGTFTSTRWHSRFHGLYCTPHNREVGTVGYSGTHSIERGVHGAPPEYQLRFRKSWQTKGGGGATCQFPTGGKAWPNYRVFRIMPKILVKICCAQFTYVLYSPCLGQGGGLMWAPKKAQAI